MADKNWQAGGRILISARALVCLFAAIAPFEAARGASPESALADYVGFADPSLVWEGLIGGIVVCCFLKCQSNMAGTGLHLSSRPAAKPACLRTHGREARPLKRSPRKYLQM